MHEHGGVREGQGAFVADQGRRLGFVGRVGLHVKRYGPWRIAEPVMEAVI